MSSCPFDDDWVPAQTKKPETIDFRSISYGPRGYKLKNKDKYGPKHTTQGGMEIESGDRVCLGSSVDHSKRLGMGRISKRCWKKRGQPACAMRDPTLSKSLTRIKEERESKKLFQQAKKEIKEARGARLREIRERRERAEQRKKENQQKSAVVEKISNPRTLKKMMKSKKQSKLLMKR